MTRREEMDTATCTTHPHKKLTFMCVVCNIQICQDCKLAQHDGHETTDIGLFASELRKKLSTEREEIEKHLRHVQSLRDGCVVEFDKTLEEAKSTMDKRVDAVIEWAKTYRLAAEGKLKELRAKRNEEIESVLDYLDENAKYFRQVLDSINDAVQDEVSDHYVINLYSDFAENHKGKHATLSELKQSVPSHSARVVTTSTTPDQCQQAVEKYLGVPLLGEVRRTASNLSMCSVTRLTCCEEEESAVKAMLPAQDGTISVLYQTSSTETTVTRLAVFTEGHKRSDEIIDNDDVIMVGSGSTSMRLFSPGSESFQQVPVSRDKTLSKEESAQVRSKMYYLKRRCPKERSVICELDCSRSPDVDVAPTVPVVELDVDDAIKVAANSTGKVFAVLRKCNQVRLYERDAPSSKGGTTIFQADSDLENTIVKDICFWTHDGVGDVVVMAEAFYGVFILVDYDGDLSRRSFFPSPRPDPSAVCSDEAGVLWIGCEGGEVFSCLPTASCDKEGVYENATTADYFQPAEAVYANILAFDQDSSGVYVTIPPDTSRNENVTAPPVPDRSTKASPAVPGFNSPLKPPPRRTVSRPTRPNVQKTQALTGRLYPAGAKPRADRGGRTGGARTLAKPHSAAERPMPSTARSSPGNSVISVPVYTSRSGMTPAARHGVPSIPQHLAKSGVQPTAKQSLPFIPQHLTALRGDVKGTVRVPATAEQSAKAGVQSATGQRLPTGQTGATQLRAYRLPQAARPSGGHVSSGGQRLSHAAGRRLPVATQSTAGGVLYGQKSPDTFRKDERLHDRHAASKEKGCSMM